MSLVELLISMVVGLFLLAGVVSNFISNQTADVKRDAVSEMDANATEAFRILRSAISHAGYRSIERTRLDNNMAFHVEDKLVPNVACRAGINRDRSPVNGNLRTRDAGIRDFLTIVNLADNPLNADGTNNPNALVYSDCTGGGANRDVRSVSCSTDPTVGMFNPSDAKIYNSFWLRNSDKKLLCRGNRSIRTEEVASDLHAIQYLYGVKNDVGDVTFRTATQVSNANQWPMIASVQVGILMRSSHKFLLDAPSSKSVYYLLDRKVTIPQDDLRRLFRIYTTTINIENQDSRVIQ